MPSISVRKPEPFCLQIHSLVRVPNLKLLQQLPQDSQQLLPRGWHHCVYAIPRSLPLHLPLDPLEANLPRQPTCLHRTTKLRKWVDTNRLPDRAESSSKIRRYGRVEVEHVVWDVVQDPGFVVVLEVGG